MKYIKLLPLLFVSLLFYACSDDENEPNANADRTEVQQWIEEKMQAQYLWNIPSTLNYGKTDPKDFFNSLLSAEDGKIRSDNKHHHYSYIEEVSSASRSSIKENYSYGFEFTGIYTGSERTAIQALVLYVIADSPAGEAGLKRGDWITEIDGTPLTDSSYPSLSGGDKCAFTIKRWDSKAGELIAQPDKIEIETARKVEDHPVFMAEVLESPKKKKVGYLVYNHFTDGKGDKDTSYDDKLREVSTKFTGVDAFVLDLRYNNGGLLSSAMVLSAILAPQKALEQKFAYLKYRDGKTSDYKLTTATYLKTGKNLNLKTLYVLVSNSTASASEMVINSLRPYMEKEKVILIGAQTEGKNVGSVPYTSDDKNWIMHPIVARIYNKDNESDYVNGFAPKTGYELDEAFVPVPGKVNTVNVIEVLPLGDPNERLLYAAMSLIDGTATANGSSRSSQGVTYQKVSASLDRKATNGVVIDIEQ